MPEKPPEFLSNQEDQTKSVRGKSEAYFGDLLETAPDAMVIMDRAGKIVLVNAQTEAIFGYRRDELLGQSIEMLIPENMRQSHPAHRADFMSALQTRLMGRDLELYALRKDGTEFPVEISLSPLETDGNLFISSAIRDISARKLRENPVFENTPIVAVTSYAMAGDRERILKAGCSEYIEKPINPETFVKEIEQYLPS